MITMTLLVSALSTAAAIILIEMISKKSLIISRADQPVMLKTAEPVTFGTSKVSAQKSNAKTLFGSPVNRNAKPVAQKAKKVLFDAEPIDYSVYDSPAYIRKAAEDFAMQQADLLKRFMRKSK